MINFAKTFLLTKLNLKKDRFRLTIWIVLMVGLFIAVASKFTTLYGSKSALNSIISTLKTPAMVSLFGTMPAGVSTSADVFAAEMTVFMTIMMVIMNYSFVIKNLRNEEDSGILEMIRAHPVGKLANLGATTIEIIILNLGIGILYSLGLMFANLDGTDTNGNFLLGIGLGVAGIMFASLAALLSQLVDNARTATILSYTIFGLMYLARMMTDVSHPKLTWLIPFGWVEKFSTYQTNDWLPILLMMILSIIFWVVTILINLNRDLGAGIIATHSGRAHASIFLNNTISLFWRLHRTSIIIWTIGIFILGFAYGSIFNNIGDILKTNPTMSQLLGPKAIQDANNMIIKQFASVLMIVFGVLALIPGIQIINYLQTGESKGYLEMIHAKPISRSKLFLSATLLAYLTTYLVLFAGIWGLQLGGVYSMEHPLALNVFLRGFWGYVSTIFIMLGISALLVGFLPKLKNLNYIYVILALLIQYFGKLLKLPNWSYHLTPFGFIPKVPVHNLNLSTFWWQILLGLVFLLIGILAYQKRDLASEN